MSRRNQHRPEKIRRLERAEMSLLKIGEIFIQLQERNNHPASSGTIFIFFSLFLLRLAGIRFNDLGFEGFTDINRRARLYIIIISTLLLQTKPVSLQFLSDLIGSNTPTLKPLLSKLLQSGYIRQLEFWQNERFGGQVMAKKHLGYELTAKGHDQIKYIFGKLIDQRIFPLS